MLIHIRNLKRTVGRIGLVLEIDEATPVSVWEFEQLDKISIGPEKSRIPEFNQS